MASKIFINGNSYSVDLQNLPADLSLNTFIREHVGLSGTKFMCQEGGCGACICVVTGPHPVTEKIETWAVNSCLTLLRSCVNWEITTIEGIGNKRDGYHPIQKRLVQMNGTQCGYCSPGFVMNMFGLLASKGGNVTMVEVENAFGGNICRCTGYRSILDAMKSFAADSNIECDDIEDLSNRLCIKTGLKCTGNCSYDRRISSLPSICKDGKEWHWANSLTELFGIFDKLKDNNYVLVSGNTAHGVYRRPDNIHRFIDINRLSALKEHTVSDESLILGAGLSITETINILKTIVQKEKFDYCKEVIAHFELIANVPVRNMGSLAGNLMIKHKYKEFPSDIFIVLEALDAEIIISESPTEQKTVSISNFLKLTMSEKVIHSIVIKSYDPKEYIFSSYKIMPRAQNSHAFVNAAFLLKLHKPSHKVLSARICYGGINPNFIHAKELEDFLVGKNLYDPKNISQLFQRFQGYLKAELVLPEPSPEYREKLALSLLYKFILKHAPIGILPKRLKSGGISLNRTVSSGTQTYVKSVENCNVWKPIEKVEGLMQSSGEAMYANDLPTQPGQLWAAFITANKIGATVTGIDASNVLKIPGVVAVFTAKDIPGKNSYVGTHEFFFPSEEELFLTGAVKFHSQPVGVIIAESNDLANKTAKLVKISYSQGSSEILPTMANVLNTGAIKRIEHNTKSPIKELQFSDSYDIHKKGKLDMGLQFHFFMEPQTTVVVPTEGGLQVYVATQWMDLTQTVLSNLLNLRNNEIQVKVRRLGGGYGGKATQCNPAAGGAALAAYKLNRTVRFVQSLESMLQTSGKRWAFHADYDFFVKNTGKIVALRCDFFEDAGYCPNESPMGHTVLLSKNCYEFTDNFKLDGHMVFTDSPSNVACRAPGSVESIAMIENIIEHIAFETGLDPVHVRLTNLIAGHKMSEMLLQFVKTTDYQCRKAEIAKFNENNRWCKKGLGLAVMEYHIGYFGEYPATMAIYHGDGTVIISHGGIEMGQGLNTKIIQVAADALGVPMELIKVEASNTVNGANSMVTGGSIGSESLCYAVRKCCHTLNERLKPVKEDLKAADWLSLISEAFSRNINLIANEDCKPSDLEPYTVCALCLTEVEVDILTGSYLVKRVDILEDTGISLNPIIDIGQIEGAFIMGLGYWTSEKIVVDQSTGKVKTNRSWNYKPPGPKDIPIDFRIELLANSANAAGFMRSKATGEPAICLSVAVVFALQEALQSSREDAGLKKEWVTLKAPMTPEDVFLNSGTTMNMLILE